MIREWTQCLRDRSEEWGLPQPGKWECLFYNNYHPHMTTINLLWFHNGSRLPQVVTKLFRTAELPHREFNNLVRAHAAAPELAPEPLHLGELGPFWAVWMRGFAGSRLRGIEDCPVEALRSIAEMIAKLHQALGSSAGTVASERYDRAVKALACVADFGSSAAVREGCGRVAAAVTPQWIGKLPVIPQHGDLYVGNILSDHGRWHLVDWENFGAVDLPLYDLTTFLLSVLWQSGKKAGKWADPAVEAIPAIVRSYCETLRLDQRVLPVLFPVVLASWFHLHYSDGRQEFSERMYESIVDYFEHTDLWEKVFVPR
jgi:Ser/Thr protein kinase RdoA (MazF antagonist)